MVPPASHRVSRVRHYLGDRITEVEVSRTGLLPSSAELSRSVRLPVPFVTVQRNMGSFDFYSRNPHAATSQNLHMHGFRLGAISLAATFAVSVDFLSSGYLDVSVPPVTFDYSILFK